MTTAATVGFTAPAPDAGSTVVADRAVLLTHGAGTGKDAPPLLAVAAALAAAGVASLRIDFPYRAAGRKAPDRTPVLLRSVREGVATLGELCGLAPERIVVGGRSMGGRMCSIVVADPADPLPALGLVLLGYPLHPAGKPEQVRDEHFPRLSVPTLFVTGTRDALAPADKLAARTWAIPGPVTHHWLESADHGFKPLASWRKETGRTATDVLTDVSRVVATWTLALL
jgi:predicted alpha/beta-hydrolase family hydrolase